MSSKQLDLESLKEILRERGFTVAIGSDGRPVLRGKIAEATPALLRVVAYYREELLSEARGKDGRGNL